MGVEPFGKHQIAGQGFQNMLPGADGLGRADHQCLSRIQGAQEVGHKAVGGPVAAADDVAGTCAGQVDTNVVKK